MAAVFSLALQLVNVLLIPALVYVVRIDRRMGQLDTLQAVTDKRLEKLERANEYLTQRLMQLEHS
jgi:hypothetical protein